MSKKRYEFWTRLCLIVAVCSAISFDKMGHLGWLAGAVGIVSAVIAMAIYFCNDGEKQKSENREPAPLAENLHDSSAESDTEHRYFGDKQLTFWAAEMSRARLPEQRIRVYFDAAALYFSQREVENKLDRERRLFVDGVVEIVERLSPTCDFELNPNGRLTIRPHLRQTPEFSIMQFADRDAPEESVQ